MLATQAWAQAPCDSVEILTVQYAPFTDSALIVIAQNTGTEFISYPQFSLLDTEGELLARESINFFGLAGAPQTHVMPLVPGAELPVSPFTGTLELQHMGMDGNDTCVFAVDGALCPVEPCTPMEVYLYSFGTSDLFTTSFPWNVTNADGQMVGDGLMAIDAADQQQDFGELCLPPGHYTLHLTQNGDVGAQYAFGVTQGGNMFTVSGPSGSMLAGGQGTLPFDYYPACITGTTGITAPASAAPVLVVSGRLLTVTAPATLGPVAVFDTSGSCVRRANASSGSTVLDLGGLAGGAYLLRSMKSDPAFPAQRFILP